MSAAEQFQKILDAQAKLRQAEIGQYRRATMWQTKPGDLIRELQMSAFAGEFRTGLRGIACTRTTYDRLRTLIRNDAEAPGQWNGIYGARRAGMWEGTDWIGTPVVVVENQDDAPDGFTWVTLAG